MKNSISSILLALTLAFSAFIAGFYVGQNTGGSDVYISGFQDATKPTVKNTTPTQPAQPTQPTQPTQPITQPTQPTTQPTQLTQPITQPTQPATDPTLATQAPTTPATKPVTLEDICPININTATQEELELLPGIGPKKAAAIIQHREKFGRFVCVEELQDVSGIGEKTLAKILEYVTV